MIGHGGHVALQELPLRMASILFPDAVLAWAVQIRNCPKWCSREASPAKFDVLVVLATSEHSKTMMKPNKISPQGAKALPYGGCKIRVGLPPSPSHARSSFSEPHTLLCSAPATLPPLSTHPAHLVSQQCTIALPRPPQQELVLSSFPPS